MSSGPPRCVHSCSVIPSISKRFTRMCINLCPPYPSVSSGALPRVPCAESDAVECSVPSLPIPINPHRWQLCPIPSPRHQPWGAPTEPVSPKLMPQVPRPRWCYSFLGGGMPSLLPSSILLPLLLQPSILCLQGWPLSDGECWIYWHEPWHLAER